MQADGFLQFDGALDLLIQDFNVSAFRYLTFLQRLGSVFESPWSKQAANMLGSERGMQSGHRVLFFAIFCRQQ